MAGSALEQGRVEWGVEWWAGLRGVMEEGWSEKGEKRRKMEHVLRQLAVREHKSAQDHYNASMLQLSTAVNINAPPSPLRHARALASDLSRTQRR